MDQSLKQRLVGVIVLTALAVIFVPMLFDDPVEQSGRSISELKIPEMPVKEFQSNLQAAPESVDDVLRTPDFDNRVQAPTQRSSGTGNGNSAKARSKLERWVIQLGSFDSKENALKFRDKLRKQGFSAFVESFNEMYRVRVGPELDRTRAEKTLALIEQKNNLKGMIVSE